MDIRRGFAFSLLCILFISTLSCFVSVRHFEGIVELALCVASKTDPHGVGLHYYKSGMPRDDIRGKEIYLLRCVLLFEQFLYYCGLFSWVVERTRLKNAEEDAD